MRATSVVTVLLPLVPVMPTTGASAARANSSTSPTISSPSRRAAAKKGSSRDTPGEATTHTASSSRRGVEPPRLTGIAASSAASCASCGGASRVSVTASRQPRALQVARTGEAGAAEPDDYRVRWCWHRGAHRSFRVASPASTRRSEMIQKRTITFGSAQPLSSK